MTGGQIFKYLTNLFGERLKSAGILMEATDAFSSRRFMGYPSTFYPVYINLIDNSLYWLNGYNGDNNSIIQREYRIILDAIGDDLLISDNGPGIPAHNHDWVFEMGNTTKPSGSGLGLFISREVLRRDGYDLTLSEQAVLGGTTFRITPTRLDKSITNQTQLEVAQ